MKQYFFLVQKSVFCGQCHQQSPCNGSVSDYKFLKRKCVGAQIRRNKNES